MGNGIKMRLLNLGKKQVDLLDELHKRGYGGVDAPVLSNSINGRLQSPLGSKVRTECLYILDEWEKAQ